jgi:hypothetical protein
MKLTIRDFLLLFCCVAVLIIAAQAFMPEAAIEVHEGESVTLHDGKSLCNDTDCREIRFIGQQGFGDGIQSLTLYSSTNELCDGGNCQKIQFLAHPLW